MTLHIKSHYTHHLVMMWVIHGQERSRLTGTQQQGLSQPDKFP